MKNLIEVQNIKKNYGKKEAVKGISFNVEEDEICFSPAILQHSVSQPKGDDLRITIAMNIDVLEE